MRGESQPPKLLLRPEEAAAVLSISRTALFGLLRSKEIFSVKIRGARRIPMAALEEYVQRLRAL
jgi:excisionase family DNA binding protein